MKSRENNQKLLEMMQKSFSHLFALACQILIRLHRLCVSGSTVSRLRCTHGAPLAHTYCWILRMSSKFHPPSVFLTVWMAHLRRYSSSENVRLSSIAISHIIMDSSTAILNSSFPMLSPSAPNRVSSAPNRVSSAPEIASVR